MNEKKLIIGFIAATILLLGGSVVFVSSSSAPKAIQISQNAKVETPETSFDWGEIKYDGPKATKTFKIKNAGSDSLQLTKVKTSCTCTTAQVVINPSDPNAKRSPIFSMHAAADWLGEVPPGQEADLVVIFDQSFHGPSGVGSIERLISVETNDAKSPKLEFTLKGNVVK